MRLDGAVAALDLPLDGARPPVKTFAGAGYRTILPKELGDALREVSRSEGVTLYVVVAALVKALLYRYTGQEDISIGCPVAGRLHHELESQIGFFINTL